MAPAAATSPYARGRSGLPKFDATSATIAGMISTAPRPSRPDQPIISTVRFGDSAVVSDPHAYTTQPIANARLRPRISPIFPPVIISDAITSVYSVIAVWIPVTVVSRSFATVAIAVFMTVVSSAITNWPAASVSRTTPVAPAARPAVVVTVALPHGRSFTAASEQRHAGTMTEQSRDRDRRVPDHYQRRSTVV